MIPNEITSGDTLNVSVLGGDQPASGGWSAVLSFNNADEDRIRLAGTADGDNHKFSTAFSGAEGTWYWQLSLTHTQLGRVTRARGSVKVLPDLLSQDHENFDGRSENEKILEAISALLAGNATLRQQTTSVDGVSLVNRSMTELVEMRRIFEGLVRREKDAERRKEGKRRPRTLIRFPGG